MIVPILPKLWSISAMETQLRGAMDDSLDYLLPLFQQTVATWNDPPTFRKQIFFRGGNMHGRIVPEGTDKQVSKYHWIDWGTQVRHALLSSDWQSKTTVGSWTSGPGQGRVVAISKNFNFDGIQARHWTLRAYKLSKKRYNSRTVLLRISIALGHRIRG